MFVINSNQSDAGARFAINGFLPFKTDGSEYRLFPIKDTRYTSSRCSGCHICDSRICVSANSASFSQAWNEASSTTYYSEYKANDMDDIVTYPEHYTGFCCGGSDVRYGPFIAMISTSVCLGCKSPTSGCQTAYSDLDGKLFYRFIGQRKFNCGDIIGKTIEGKLTIGWAACAGHFSCEGNTYSYVNTCPFGIRMEIGLIHKDATQSSLICRDMELPWGCLYNDNCVCLCNSSCGIWSNGCYGCCSFLPGILDTDGIEAQDGDRLYIEYKTFGGIKMQYWACANNVDIGDSATKNIVIGSTNKTCYNVINYQNYVDSMKKCVSYNTACPTSRYEGIGVSVDQS